MCLRRFCLACVALSLVAGCKKSDATGKPTVAVVPKGQLALFWQSVHAGAVRGGRDSGVDVSWNGPQAETDLDAQIRIIDDMLAKGVKAFVLANTFDNGFTHLLGGLLVGCVVGLVGGLVGRRPAQPR